MAAAGAQRAVAVIVPVFNRLELLRETVDSLRAQTLANSEFLLVDDGSTDDVWLYLQELPHRDSRFHILRKPDGVARGCQEGRNLGLSSCRAEGVVFLDSDDLLSPTCIADRYGELQHRADMDIIIGRQAIFTSGQSDLRWVNIPGSAIEALDRFLHLANPVDVPWINGGVMIRHSRLQERSVRWRAEYLWDDVAFHFDCLTAGLRSRWMDRMRIPDSLYRMHTGTRYGGELHGKAGIRNVVAMIRWMWDEVCAFGLADPARRQAVANSLFHLAYLRSVDEGNYSYSEELVQKLAADGILHQRERMAWRIYGRGRRSLRRSARATYYWNRVARNGYMRSHLRDRSSTYGCLPVGGGGGVPEEESGSLRVGCL